MDVRWMAAGKREKKEGVGKTLKREEGRDKLLKTG